MKFFNNDGDITSEWYEVIICPGKVVSVYLLIDRYYVSNSVFLEFLYYLRRECHFRVCGIVHSRKVVNNIY